MRLRAGGFTTRELALSLPIARITAGRLVSREFSDSAALERKQYYGAMHGWSEGIANWLAVALRLAFGVYNYLPRNFGATLCAWGSVLFNIKGHYAAFSP